MTGLIHAADCIFATVTMATLDNHPMNRLNHSLPRKTGQTGCDILSHFTLAIFVVEVKDRIGNGFRVTRRHQVTILLVFHHFHQSTYFADNDRFSETKSQLHNAALGSRRIGNYYQVSRGKKRLYLFIRNVVLHEGHFILQTQFEDEIAIDLLVVSHFTGTYSMCRLTLQNIRQTFQKVAQAFVFSDEAKEQ